MIISVEIAFSFKRELDEAYRRLELPDGATVLDALCALGHKYPPFYERVFVEEGVIRKHVNTLVNGRNVQFQAGLDTVLRDGDRLSILPPVGGG
jgi:sulfur-carrier protein